MKPSIGGHFSSWQLQYRRHKCKDGQTCICGMKNKIALGSSASKERSLPLNWKGTLCCSSTFWGGCYIWFVVTQGRRDFSRLAAICWTPECNINPFMLMNLLGANWNGLCSLLGLECYFWWGKTQGIVLSPPSGKYIGANVRGGHGWTVYLHFCLT